MHVRKIGSIVLASAFTIFLSTGFALAQDGAKQDMKAAVRRIDALHRRRHLFEIAHIRADF